MDRWPADKANRWYDAQPWLVGCNYIPRVAINQLEMWQAETFAPDVIAEELTWAAGLGFNTVRTYLHDLCWEEDVEGFKWRIDEFLQAASSRGIRPILVFFDDCWNAHPKTGPQPRPRPGVHNSGWVQSPGGERVSDPAAWPRLERYVRDVVRTFARDERVLLWDLYNEPGNGGRKEASLPLLRHAFEWAREAAPTQPVTAGLWFDNAALNAFQLAASDVVTFHNYGDVEGLKRRIAELKAHGRPLVCTEYMARPLGSRFQSHLPVFKARRVGCLNWGLVSGKTQTCFPWNSPEGAPEPEVWFHDIFRADGLPFDADEADFIRSMTRRASGQAHGR